ncbi:MAG: hypothetical protein ACOCVG_04065, partial [Verrucomicrobiota bacterium]
MNDKLIKWLPIALAGLMALWFVVESVPRPSARGEFDLRRFAELPVQLGGRIKPLDSVARNNLLILSERQSVETPSGQELSATEWMAEMAMNPEEANTYKVFKLVFPEDLALGELTDAEGRYHSYYDLLPYREEIAMAASNANPEPQLRDAYQRQMVKLASNLDRYERLLHSFHPPDNLDRIEQEYAAYHASIPGGARAMTAQMQGEEYDEEALQRLRTFGERYAQLSRIALLSIV